MSGAVYVGRCFATIAGYCVSRHVPRRWARLDHVVFVEEQLLAGATQCHLLAAVASPDAQKEQQTVRKTKYGEQGTVVN